MRVNAVRYPYTCAAGTVRLSADRKPHGFAVRVPHRPKPGPWPTSINERLVWSATCYDRSWPEAPVGTQGLKAREIQRERTFLRGCGPGNSKSGAPSKEDCARARHAHLRLGEREGRRQAAIGCVSAQSVEHLCGASNLASEAVRVPTRSRRCAPRRLAISRPRDVPSRRLPLIRRT